MTNKTTSQPLAISLDIDSERILGALISPDGRVDSLHAVTSPVADGTDAILQTLVVVSRRLMEKANSVPIVGIGVSTVGLVHHTNGTIIHADATLPELQNIPIAEVLESEYNLPTRVENNVNAMAIAEINLGVGRTCESFFYIYADKTLNGALVQGGRIWRGSHSSAGQIGNLLVGWLAEKPQHLSQRASGDGIASDYIMRSRRNRKISINDIVQFARHGDQLAIRVIRDGAHVLGSVLSPVVSLIDPECVVVGGLLSDIGELWWKPFQVALKKNTLPALREVEIIHAVIDEHAGLIGAGLLAHEGVPSR